jgi:GDP-mannose 4,6-dehydratase
MKKNAIITGITGQDGAYLAELLLDKGYTIYGTYRRTASTNFWRVEELGVKGHPNLHLVEYDVTDLGSSIRLLQKAEAIEVYNLAAQSFVAVLFEHPIATEKIAGLGPVHLLEAIQLVNPRIRFYAEIHPLNLGENPSNRWEEEEAHREYATCTNLRYFRPGRFLPRPVSSRKGIRSLGYFP